MNETEKKRFNTQKNDAFGDFIWNIYLFIRKKKFFFCSSRMLQ